MPILPPAPRLVAVRTCVVMFMFPAALLKDDHPGIRSALGREKRLFTAFAVLASPPPQRMVPHLTRQSTSPLFLYLIRPAVCCVIDDIVALGWMLAVNKRFSLTRPVCLLPFFLALFSPLLRALLLE